MSDDLKNNRPSDSLELLLDTMCNSFGGVMFIAIALVVISSIVPDKPSGAARPEPAALRSELTRLETETEALRHSRSFESELLQRQQSPARLAELRELAALKDANDRLTQRLRQARSRSEDSRADLKTAATRAAQHNEESRKLQASLAVLERESARLRKLGPPGPAERRELAFPKLEATDKTPFLVILKGGRLHRVSDPRQQNLLANNQVNVSPDVRCVFDPAKNQLRFTPVKGVPPTKALDKLLTQIDRDDKFVWLMTMDDSFPELVEAVKRLRAAGFAYYWVPVTDDAELRLNLVDQAEYQSY